MYPRVISASTMMDNPVHNAQGEDLGNIEDFMVDTEAGCIAYAVLSFGGFLGIGDKLFAVPWHALSLDMEDETFILNVSKESLENAPGFDKDNWPDFADERWAREVHEFYHVRPYWEAAHH